jgi:hypothetical protein
MIQLEGERVEIRIQDKVKLDESNFSGESPWVNTNSISLMPVYKKVPVLPILREAADSCAKYYPLHSVDVEISHSNGKGEAFDIACNGAAGSRRVYLYFYSQHPKFPDTDKLYKEVERVLPAITSHELGHTARFREGIPIGSLSSWAVHEAAALHMQRMVHPNIELPPKDPTDEQVEFLERKIAEQGSIGFSYDCLDEWKFGKNGFPVRGMYMLARSWLDRFMKSNPGSQGEIFKIPDKEFIAQVAPSLV